MALGLAFQASFPFAPVDNYTNFVYWLLYLPILLAFSMRRSLFVAVLRVNLRMWLSVAALLTWVAITALWSDSGGESESAFVQAVENCLMILLYLLGVAVLAYQAPGSLLRAVLAACCAVALLAVLSTLNHLIVSEASIFERLTKAGIGNWTEEFNPVVLGIYFGAFSLISLVVAFRGFKGGLERFVLSACAIVCFVATVLTGTRTALLALFAVTSVYLLGRQHRWTAVSVATIACGVVAYIAMDPSSVMHDYVARNGLSTLGLRPQAWLASLQLALDRPWFGLGLWSEFSFTISQPPYTYPVAHSHNFYLQLLVWTGVIGLLLYLNFLAQAVVLARRLSSDPVAGLSFWTLAYFAVVQLFDVYNVFTRPDYYWVCLWLPIGAVLGVAARGRADVQSASPQPNSSMDYKLKNGVDGPLGGR
ncbi:O-antigen ligase family protein [Proteobacteria bacterium 005FR1]|nr:O-antigen ligase family protein [Proteobacteria bacterium 005FR1]